MKNTQPTESQGNLLRKFQAFVFENGYPPTIRELGRMLGFTSTNAISCSIRILERKGYVLQRKALASRGRVLTPKAQAWLHRINQM